MECELLNLSFSQVEKSLNDKLPYMPPQLTILKSNNLSINNITGGAADGTYQSASTDS